MERVERAWEQLADIRRNIRRFPDLWQRAPPEIVSMSRRRLTGPPSSRRRRVDGDEADEEEEPDSQEVVSPAAQAAAAAAAAAGNAEVLPLALAANRLRRRQLVADEVVGRATEGQRGQAPSGSAAAAAVDAGAPADEGDGGQTVMGTPRWQLRRTQPEDPRFLGASRGEQGDSNV